MIKVILICRYKHVTNDGSDPREAGFYNILLEEEALRIKPCTDEKLLSSAHHSTLSFIGEFSYIVFLQHRLSPYK
jgi:hypothetical protein